MDGKTLIQADILQHLKDFRIPLVYFKFYYFLAFMQFPYIIYYIT